MKQTFSIFSLVMVFVLVISLIGIPIPTARAAGFGSWTHSMEYVPLSLPNGLDEAYLEDVWGSSTNNVYAVGGGSDATDTSHPVLYHHNGMNWAEASSWLPDAWDRSVLHGVWGSSESNVYIVGDGNDMGENASPIYYHYDGTDWTAHSLLLSSSFSSGYLVGGAWGSSENDVYFGGYAYDTDEHRMPLVYHYDDTGWTEHSFILPDERIEGVIANVGGLDASHVYAVGRSYDASGAIYPLLYYCDGTDWTTISLSSRGAFSGIWAFNENDVYIAGYGYDTNDAAIPVIYHYDGADWTTTELPLPADRTSVRLDSIWAAGANDMYAVGHSHKRTDTGGVILPVFYHNDGTGWVESTPSLPGTWDGGALLSMWGFDQNHLYLVGSGASVDNPAIGKPLLYSLDRTAPTVSSIVRASAASTSAASVDFTVNFSEPVTGVDEGDFTLVVGGEIEGADITGVVPVDACTGSLSCDIYTVTVDTGIENGTLGLDLAEDVTINDMAGNALAEQPFAPDQEYTVVKPLTLLSPTNGEVLLHRRPTFDWTNVSGATSYQIIASTSRTFGTVLWKANTPTSTYTRPTDLPAGKVIYWRIRALVSGVWGSWSQTGSFRTPKSPSVPVLSLPANKAITKDYTPLLKWKSSTIPSGGAAFDYYQVQVSTDNTFPEPLLIDALTPSGDRTVSFYTPGSELDPNQPYFWRVRAFNVAGEYSSWSTVRSFSTALLPPSNLTPTGGEAMDTRKPVLDWDAVEGASGYTVQVSTSSSFGTLLVNTKVTADTFTPGTNLPANRTLYWRVRATGTNGPSDWTTASFHTP